jgi:hypothetical protein
VTGQDTRPLNARAESRPPRVVSLCEFAPLPFSEEHLDPTLEFRPNQRGAATLGVADLLTRAVADTRP